MGSGDSTTRPPLPANVRLFVAFRVLFNARFYYPVLAVLFVDLGLTLTQYALLNVAWAVSIVVFELPLGAVSDRIGRRPLVVGAAALMVVEMSVLAFAPTGNATLLFVLFLLNRVLSGLAEAAASGADEALAYDALLAAGRKTEWPDVLGKLQRWMAGGFLAAMLTGGAVYDSGFLNDLFGTHLTPADTMRLPVYLTLAMAVGALFTALRMTEPPVEGETGEASWPQIRSAAKFVIRTRFVLAVILFFLVLDSVVRLFLTLNSSYYRMIGIPAALFGVLGAAFAALGFVSPSVARRLLDRLSPRDNFGILAGLALFSLAGIAAARSWWGALFVAPLAVGFHMLSYFVSQYLNEATESSRRATVLSMKSLAGNLAYGAAGILYAAAFRAAGGGEAPAAGSPAEEALLAKTLLGLPVALVLVNVPLWLWARRLPRMGDLPRDAVARVREYVRLSNEHDVESIGEMLAEDAVYRSARTGAHQGREAILEMMRDFFETRPDVRWSAEGYVLEDDGAVAFRYAMTRRSEDGGEAESRGRERVRLDANGRIVEVTVEVG